MGWLWNGIHFIANPYAHNLQQGDGMGSISTLMLPLMLALAGGAMLYVVSDEMIPETHSHGYQKVATYALVLGFVTLVFLDLAF